MNWISSDIGTKFPFECPTDSVLDGAEEMVQGATLQPCEGMGRILHLHLNGLTPGRPEKDN